MKANNYSTIYDFVYSYESGRVISSRQYSELGYPIGYMVAAVKKITKGGRVTSIDQYIEKSAWVDADLDGAREIAIKKRSGK